MAKIIMTSGSYDLLHFGHLNVLLKAKTYGDFLIVGVSTDELIKKYKGLGPIIKYKDRASLIKQLRCVDRVVKQKTLVDIEQFKKLKADVFALGDDWKENYSNKGINWLRDNNKIIWIPYTKRLSTTKIKNYIIDNASKIKSNLESRC